MVLPSVSNFLARVHMVFRSVIAFLRLDRTCCSRSSLAAFFGSLMRSNRLRPGRLTPLTTLLCSCSFTCMHMTTASEGPDRSDNSMLACICECHLQQARPGVMHLCLQQLKAQQQSIIDKRGLGNLIVWHSDSDNTGEFWKACCTFSMK